MKILIDMNLSPRWVKLFDDAGVESAHWSTIGATNAPDKEIMDYAKANIYCNTISIRRYIMGKELNGLLEEVLNMPQQQRAFLASQLIDSLEPQVDIDIEAAWQQEVNKRVSQAKEGLVTFIPWGEARRRLKGV